MVARLTDAISAGDIAQFAARQIGDFIEACKLDKIVSVARTNRYGYKLAIPEQKQIEQKCLKQISFDLVFGSPGVQQLEYKAQKMLKYLFEVLRDNYICQGQPKHHLLNEDVEQMIQNGGTDDRKARLLCDYISGMTDDYVVRTCRRLTDPEFGSIVDLV